ncbi:MAG: class I SAM-dependent methyltransferase [Solirubrobacteraceae bacterium]
MTKPTYDRDHWEQLWSQTLSDPSDHIARRPPNLQLTTAIKHLRPGRALDAGCGHGSDTLWLATHGWQVTAVDFSKTALANGRSRAQAAGADIAERIHWVQADLATWPPQPHHYDLVACLYVHIARSVEEMVQRLAAAVAPHGTLLLVGHQPVDPATGAATPAAGQVQVSTDRATAALDPAAWTFVAAEDRPRGAAGIGVDAVIHARRLP